MNKYFITFLVVLFSGLAAYYVIHFGYYPMAVVNGEVVSAHRFNREYQVAFQYYAKVNAKQQEVDVTKLEFQQDLRRAVLSGIIERYLIADALESKVGGDFSAIVQKKLDDQKMNSEAVEQVARLVYGLSLADFRDLILVPKAEREVLEGRLLLEKKNLDAWLAEQAKNAKVLIVTPEFFWQDGKLNTRI